MVPRPPDLELVEGLLEMSEVARVLKVSEYTARELGRSGKLPIVRVGRHVRVRPSSLKRYIEQQEK